MENCGFESHLVIWVWRHKFKRIITIFKSCYGQLDKIVRRIEVSEEKWHGIPRSKIPWFPSIDYEKCLRCGKCVEYCKLGTYEFEEKENKRPLVKNPNNCVVMCSGCDSICPVGAITHPSKKEFQNKLTELRTDSELKLKSSDR
jgi:NAD-dependent dihydropyrimidine dehydrogenase PreA subunit